jgi:hypothetical protein
MRSADGPGAVRRALDRLRAATGATALDQLEERVDAAGIAVAENRSLEIPMAVLLDGVEASLVPLLEGRLAPREQGEPGPA